MARLDQILAHTVRAAAIGPKTVSPGTANPGILIGNAKFTISSGGLVAGTTGMYGFTAVRAGTGIYSLTFPAAPSGSRLALKYNVEIAQAHLNVSGITLAQFTGTAQFRFVDGGGLGVNGVAGDTFNVDFYLDPASLSNTVP